MTPTEDGSITRNVEPRPTALSTALPAMQLDQSLGQCKPNQAAHTLGKLVKHVGAKRVLWGSDSIWYGSPQDQIQAFRAFQISEEFQQKYGYSSLTPQLKADIFGLNAATIYGVDPSQVKKRSSQDPLGRMKAEYRENPEPTYAALGPRDADEWRRFVDVHGVGPG